jgi:hypothetical protein
VNNPYLSTVLEGFIASGLRFLVLFPSLEITRKEAGARDQVTNVLLFLVLVLGGLMMVFCPLIDRHSSVAAALLYTI